MGLVLCRLPKAGLGNQLFPLMKAYVLGYLNNLPVIVTGYHQIKIGPYLRGEKSKRKYSNYFTFQKNIWGEQIDKWRTRRNAFVIQKEPPLEKLVGTQSVNKMYEYGSLPHWADYFSELRNYRHIVIQLFWDILNQEIKEKVSAQNAPCIGVHIRMGDFRKLNPLEDFSKVGTVRTPEEYFVNVIETIRELHGSNLPVTLFTDGYKSELSNLLAMENIQVSEDNLDIVDMLLLSKSKVIVTSAGSTFSYWSGFLSSSPLIIHPDHIHAPIRQSENDERLYEGSVNGLTKDYININ